MVFTAPKVNIGQVLFATGVVANSWVILFAPPTGGGRRAATPACASAINYFNHRRVYVVSHIT